jgi:hypothetical protein
MLNMGVENNSDTFAVFHRPALFEDQQAGDDYIANKPGVVFRITPNESTKLDPYNYPELRVRGTGKTEFDLADDLEQLREAILNEYSNLNATVISGLKVHNPGGLKVHTSTSLASNPKGCGDVAGRRVPHVKRPLQTGIEHQRDCPSNRLQSQDSKQIRKSQSSSSIQETISKAKQAGFLQGLHHPAPQ